MRVSRSNKKDEAPEADTFPTSRVVTWAIVGLVILAGLALYFRYGRFMRPLL